MILKELKAYFLDELTSIYPQEEIESFFNILAEHMLNFKRIDVVLNAEKTLSLAEKASFESALFRLKNQEPIQYITGETEFYGLPFRLNPSVLIPRPETEELVDWILKDCKGIKPLQILDIGTGSGCIAISLAKHLPNATVTAIDISEEALKTAQENARLNLVTVNFIEQDALRVTHFSQAYDIIVSNPPYVRNLEKAEINPNVLDNEPHLALFVEDDNPLLFYRAITMMAQKNLKQDGSLYFEINQYLGEETKSMIKNNGFANVVLRQDLFGNHRMIKATF